MICKGLERRSHNAIFDIGIEVVVTTLMISINGVDNTTHSHVLSGMGNRSDSESRRKDFQYESGLDL